MRRFAQIDWFSWLVLVLGLAYVWQGWTPSSYGWVLEQFGAKGLGLVWGTPKGIRSDEWAVWTPYLQIAVNNGFGRFNATSPFGEDLRNFNALPLKDWGLIFKPQFWPFFAIGPVRAFSFSHAIFIVAFLAGYHRLLRALDFPAAWSIPAALLLFCTSYTQLWWTTTGPLLALFPWLLLIVLHDKDGPGSWGWRLPLLAWLTAVWLLSHLYPPIILTIGLAGALIVLALRPSAFRPGNLIPALIAGVIGGAVAWVYLADAMAVMGSTVYPGRRVVDPGTVTWPQWLAQFFPHLVSRGMESLAGLNVAEVATGGSYLPLLALIFVDHRALSAIQAGGSRPSLRWMLVWPVLGLAAMSLWMLAPVPVDWGKPLLWHQILPQRMTFACGLLALVIALVLLRAAPARLTWPRLLLAAAFVAGAWFWSKDGQGPWLSRLNLIDLAVLAPLAVALVLRGWLASRVAAGAALVGAAALANMAGFGHINPIQSAAPIFGRPHTPITAVYDELASRHPQRWLATTGAPGASANGWGYKSISHVQIAPQLRFFRSYFLDMPEAEFNRVFNRYAHIQLSESAEVAVPQPDLIVLPAQRFGAPVSRTALELVASAPVAELAAQGHVDQIVADGDAVVLRGWALFQGDRAGRTIELSADFPVKSAELRVMARPDVVGALGDRRLIDSGFELRIVPEGMTASAAAARAVCVVSRDSAGRYALASPPGLSQGCAR